MDYPARVCLWPIADIEGFRMLIAGALDPRRDVPVGLDTFGAGVIELAFLVVGECDTHLSNAGCGKHKN